MKREAVDFLLVPLIPYRGDLWQYVLLYLLGTLNAALFALHVLFYPFMLMMEALVGIGTVMETPHEYRKKLRWRLVLCQFRWVAPLPSDGTHCVFEDFYRWIRKHPEHRPLMFVLVSEIERFTGPLNYFDGYEREFKTS
jgi:hypothetical protein